MWVWIVAIFTAFAIVWSVVGHTGSASPNVEAKNQTFKPVKLFHKLHLHKNKHKHIFHVKRKPLRQRVVTKALALRGIPYMWGGTTRRGFDCSGFTRYVFQELKVYIGRDTYAQIGAGKRIMSLAKARAGDLLFPTYSHVMLYLGRNLAIHSPHSGSVVHVIPASSRSYIEIRRVQGVWKKLVRPKVS